MHERDTGWIEGPRGSWTRIVGPVVCRIQGFVGIDRRAFSWDWTVGCGDEKGETHSTRGATPGPAKRAVMRFVRERYGYGRAAPDAGREVRGE